MEKNGNHSKNANAAKSIHNFFNIVHNVKPHTVIFALLNCTQKENLFYTHELIISNCSKRKNQLLKIAKSKKIL